MDDKSILSSVSLRENLFLKKVYMWMALGLALTGIVAFAVASSVALLNFFFSNSLVLLLLFVAEFAIVFVLSGRIERLSTGAAITCFFAYSAINGITLSSLFVIYAGTNILSLSFFVAAFVFILASLYGALTKKSIKGWGGWLSMSLLALVGISLVNLFLGSSRLDMIISCVGVLVFTLLTAWDSQKIISLNRDCGAYMTKEEMNKISILGALELYLDFINILLYLIRIFSYSRRDN